MDEPFLDGQLRPIIATAAIVAILVGTAIWAMWRNAGSPPQDKPDHSKRWEDPD